MKRVSLILILAMVLMIPLAGVAADQKEVDQPKVAATVNGEVITVGELDRMYQRLSPQMRENYDRAGGKAQFLNTYIRKRLVLQEAFKQNFDKQPDVKKDIQAATESVLFDHYVRDVVAAPIVTEAAVREYYQLHKAEFLRPPMIKVRHILATPTEAVVNNTTGDNAKTREEALAKIQRIGKLIHTGANFGELAAAYSEDNTALSGGDLGWVTPGRMVKEFDDAAFAMHADEISPVVETQFGYHIIWVEARKEGGIAPLEDVRGEIRERLLADKAPEILAAVEKLTQELRTHSTITINNENF